MAIAPRVPGGDRSWVGSHADQHRYGEPDRKPTTYDDNDLGQQTKNTRPSGRRLVAAHDDVELLPFLAMAAAVGRIA
ncbi:hypothetical protein [Streptomyces scopuliridis]|uniref:hypothetical protein n=1 Tax=Streptomyces scopuliridis TaxID=452529 RepID=UPI0036C1FC25